MYFKERGRNSIYFNFDDIGQNEKSFVSNVSQADERQMIEAFIEKYKAKL